MNLREDKNSKSNLSGKWHSYVRTSLKNTTLNKQSSLNYDIYSSKAESANQTSKGLLV